MLDAKSKAALSDMLHGFASASGDRDVLRAARTLLRVRGGRHQKENTKILVREAAKRLTENASRPSPKKKIEILRAVVRDVAPYEKDREVCAERIRKLLKKQLAVDNEAVKKPTQQI